MATLSEAKITFLDDIPLGVFVLFKDTYTVPFIYTEEFVTTRSAPNEVTIGTPTGIPGEISAINYVTSFNLDYNSLGNYDVSRVDNVVTIKAIDFNATFEAVEFTGNVTYEFTNVFAADYNRVSARSPYFVTSPIYNGVTTVTPLSVTFDLYVWQGDVVTNKPIEPSYSYTKQPEYLGKEFIYMDIAPQIKSFITNNYTGDYEVDPVWFNVDTTTTYDTGTIESSQTKLAFYGYGNQSENTNPTPDNDLMINNRFISVLKDDSIPLVFYTGGDDYTVELRDNLTILDTMSIVGGGIINTGAATEIVEFQAVEEANNVLVKNTTKATEFVIDVEVVTECIYEPIKGTFVNKQGVFQDIYFYKVSSESMKVKSDDYRANVLTESIVNNVPTITYDTTRHGTKTTNSQGKTEIEVNTGFINEDNNILVKEMLLSESIWLTINNVITPVNLKSKSVNYMTKRNDQLIKYKFKFEYSYNEVQDIV